MTKEGQALLLGVPPDVRTPLPAADGFHNVRYSKLPSSIVTTRRLSLIWTLAIDAREADAPEPKVVQMSETQVAANEIALELLGIPVARIR